MHRQPLKQIDKNPPAASAPKAHQNSASSLPRALTHQYIYPFSSQFPLYETLDFHQHQQLKLQRQQQQLELGRRKMGQPAFESQRTQLTLENQRQQAAKSLFNKENKAEKQASENTINRPELKQNTMGSN